VEVSGQTNVLNVMMWCPTCLSTYVFVYHTLQTSQFITWAYAVTERHKQTPAFCSSSWTKTSSLCCVHTTCSICL